MKLGPKLRKIKNFGKNLSRKLIASAYRRFKLVPPPSIRFNGISVMLPVLNEKTWIKTSLASIKNYVDEILIGDSGSTDGTLEEIKIFIEENPDLDVQFFDCKNMNFIEQQNFLLHKTRYRWVMRWMGDWIGHTSGKSSIQKVRKYILSLNPNRYYGFTIIFPNLFMDPFHVYAINKEIWIHNYHKDVYRCYSNLPSPFEDLWLPNFFEIFPLKNHHVFHCTIKSKEVFLNRLYWGEWEKTGRLKYPTIKDLALARIKKDFNTDDYNEACKIFMGSFFPKVKKYSKEKFGEYPDLLKPFLKNPPYRLIYQDGKIISRSDL